MAPSYSIMEVALPRMPILCSMERLTKPLRRSLRSGADSAGRNFGTRNSEMPRLPAGASGSLASTKCTMLSAKSCSPLVMKILVPVRP